MQSLITCVLIIAFISPCLCHRWNVGTQNTIYNVIDFGAVGDGKTDDTQAFLKAWQSMCEAQGTSTLLIPPNKVFLVTSMLLKGPCVAPSVQIQLQGVIVAPTKDAWVEGNLNTLIMISNVNGLTIDGSGGLIDGYGSAWWACKSCPRPSVLIINSCNSVSVTNLNMINSPKSHIHVNGCEGATFSHINISAPGDSPNTDGFDISTSKNIMIEDSTIATGDDCIAISGGSSYINVTGIACGPGHGISIGSLGKKFDTVQEVYVRNCSFIRTTNGARIKTFPNQAVEVSDVTYRGIHGTSLDGRAITLDCGESGCYGIVLDQINIVSCLTGKSASCFCNNAHGTATATNPNCTCLLP
ncbi:probable polygalacturonase At3g15720 isoform X2 [Glycine soja]|uniref:Polygalacturonase n=1 Tax=Glycine max TaxID=3847 RepID=K7KE18_SOYBN|nr:probable polygalacturonase At3g15720 isoform X2 [Glycine soja]XP_028223784.1 probable polygalacturonase At3g15720 isoform X2 [Glycine soja]|eukprot:XP_025983625.1 probable polygalacturonase At3g15720 isoform X2 [Glycine max]